MDTVSKAKRSEIMSKVRSKNTKPEKIIRSLLHSLGYRFRLHRKDLPGWPDIVLPKYKTVIFVNGCFWHRHHGCPRATTPKTNTKFWVEKFNATTIRDKRNYQELAARGWSFRIIWECEIQYYLKTPSLLKQILEGASDVDGQAK